MEQLLAGRQEETRRLSVVGFHGHTVFHAPEQGKTLQIGDSARLAQSCNTRVVGNFRQKDMEHGGQGAPLAPLYHRAVARQLRASGACASEHSLVFVNIGGVANVTWISPCQKDNTKKGKTEKGKTEKGKTEESKMEEQATESMLAFDVGAGNALLDDWVSRRTDLSFDRNGMLASKGMVSARVLRRLLDDSFFALPPPKSLDRDHFTLALLDAAGLSLEDGAATLTDFLVESLCLARRFFPSSPRQWLLCGGGRKNRAIVQGLRQALASEQVAVCPIDDLGFDGDALEAQAFAYLAVRHLCGLPSAYPVLTGARKATCGGDLYPCG